MGKRPSPQSALALPRSFREASLPEKCTVPVKAGALPYLCQRCEPPKKLYTAPPGPDCEADGGNRREGGRQKAVGGMSDKPPRMHADGKGGAAAAAVRTFALLSVKEQSLQTLEP